MIGNVPVIQYVGDTIIAELQTLKRPTYQIDVNEADWAPFDFDDEMLVTHASQGPCYFVWLGPIGFSENQIGGTKDVLAVDYRITGAAVNSKDVQSVVTSMITDLHRLMRTNNNRNYPGETGGNDYCKGTRFKTLVPTFGRTASSMGIGIFDAVYTCDVIFPRATG